jgi:hypothetical protein
MRLRNFATGFLFCATSAAAFAQTEVGGINSVTINDLKAKCKTLLADPQIKPQRLKLSCDAHFRYWTQSKPIAGSLPNARSGGYTVQLKGYTVPRQAFDVTQQATGVECQQWVEMEKIVSSVDVEMACTDLLAIDDFNGYCTTLVDQRLKDDPALATIRATGVTDGNCPKGAALN